MLRQGKSPAAAAAPDDIAAMAARRKADTAGLIECFSTCESRRLECLGRHRGCTECPAGTRGTGPEGQLPGLDRGHVPALLLLVELISCLPSRLSALPWRVVQASRSVTVPITQSVSGSGQRLAFFALGMPLLRGIFAVSLRSWREESRHQTWLATAVINPCHLPTDTGELLLLFYFTLRTARNIDERISPGTPGPPPDLSGKRNRRIMPVEYDTRDNAALIITSRRPALFVAQ